uniref:Uncharacterized protein n=1 Tax=Vitis vinifera TaxID=29760 RepID=F6HLT6_VITVI
MWKKVRIQQRRGDE